MARFDEGEWAAIGAAAARSGLTATGFVASAAVAAARGTQPPGSPVREALHELMAARTAVNVVGGLVNQIARAVHVAGLAGEDLDVDLGVQLSRASAAVTRTAARVDEAASMVQGRIS